MIAGRRRTESREGVWEGASGECGARAPGAMLIGVRAGEAGGCSPLSWAKETLFFRANAKFFGQNPTAKMESIVFIKRKHGIHSVQQDEVPEIITIITTGCAY